jgi:activator of HSP90 ATPase
MLPPIQQSLRFPAPAAELYALYLSPKRHAAFTGAPVKISPKPNSPFSAFLGMLTGTTLSRIPPLITRYPKTT